MAIRRSNFVANQVFIGCPWKTIKPKYERAIEKLSKKYPISFILVGREEQQDAEDLLGIIKNALDSSSYAIFDATLGNANVSLEFGYAEGRDIPRVIYLSSHGAVKKNPVDRAIISDLAGKKHISYTTEAVLLKNLTAFAKNHAYSKRFEAYIHRVFKNYTHGPRRSHRAGSLKIIHCLDGQTECRREDIVQKVISENEYRPEAVELVLKEMHRDNLIKIDQGRYARVHIV